MWGRIVIGDSRSMVEVARGVVDLVVTSPPYWHIKDYGVPGQIGYGQTLHRYLRDLHLVWAECHRCLSPGGRLCVNIGDQFARSALYGRYKVVPLHAEVIAQAESLGLDFLGSIIWQKKTRMETTGGATVMGSYPYPPNGLVELDYEYIHIFKKPGGPRQVPAEVKQASRLTKAEWKEFFSGHWRFAGARQIGHEARFPEELPRRLIRMFTFAGDTVLDPFLGSGTVLEVGLRLGRNVVGYEINPDYLEVIRQRVARDGDAVAPPDYVEIVTGRRAKRASPERGRLPRRGRATHYAPWIADLRPLTGAARDRLAPEDLHRVAGIVNDHTIRLANGVKVEFLGVAVKRRAEALRYLTERILGKQVYLRLPAPASAATPAGPTGGALPAYVHLKNRLFVNAYLLRSGLAVPDRSTQHPLAAKFARLAGETTRA
jgi:DNA modification methylase